MKNNLLVLSHTYNSFIKDQVEILSKHFDEVYVLVRYKPVAEISNFLPIYGLKDHRQSVAIDLTNKPENVKIFPVSLYYLPTEFFYRNLGTWHYKVAKKIVEKNNLQFNLIHSHFLWTSSYVGGLLKHDYNVPHVATAHGEGIYQLPFINEMWERRIKNVLNSTDKIITVSKSNVACVKKLNIKKEVFLIPNGFRETIFFPKPQTACRKTLGLPLNKNILLSIGYLESIKNHELLIKALEICKKNGVDFCCYIIGEGSLRTPLQKLISSSKLETNVFLTGSKSHVELNDWINACDLSVLPSIAESFGVVQIESMACGVPVVATRNGGSEDIIVNDNLGYLCENGNAIDLAAKITSALEKRWNKNIIINHSVKYRWDTICKEIYDVYRQALKQK